MPNQIICPKCRRLQVPLEESGQLICPACSSILPSNFLLPELAAKTIDRGSASGMGSSTSSRSNALDEPESQAARPVGAMTLLRKDLKTGEQAKPTGNGSGSGSGWLDNVLTRRAKAVPERVVPPVNRNPRPQPEAKVRQEFPPVDPSSEHETLGILEEPSTSLPQTTPIKDQAPVHQMDEPIEAEGRSIDRNVVVSILTTLGFVVVSSVALLQNQSFWTTLLLFATTVLLGVSVLGIIHRQGTPKAFWQGFALFGWGYLVMAFIPCFPTEAGLELPTSPLLKIIHAKVTASPVDARDTFQILKGAPALLPVPPETATPDVPETTAKTSASASSSFFTAGSIKQFVVVGHCLLALLTALAGSLVAKWFYRSQFEMA